MSRYQIQKGPAKLLDNFRGDRIWGDTYSIYKDGLHAYEVTISTLGEWCNCPGFEHHSKCKHMGMVYKMLTEDDENEKKD